jgi:glutamate N-acetyltransferase/amino-acid N-acetyltransferase
MSVTAPRGFVASGVHAGIRRSAPDLAALRSTVPAVGGAMFSRNQVQAAPLQVNREHVARAEPQAVVVNSGVANAATGERGKLNALATAAEAGRLLGLPAEQVLVLSTGVIGVHLPMDKLLPGLKTAVAELSEDGGSSAAEAIMTTDTVPKAASAKVRLSAGDAAVTGIAKGAGMIRPDMATMLGFVATDAGVPRAKLDAMVRRVADRSFNCITVDGDTSTNDAFMLIASGAGPAVRSARDLDKLEQAVTAVARQLAQAIVRDAEGATKFVTVRVERGRSSDECRRVAYAIAHSPLVKTAFFASDPNLGRILAAIGYSGVPLDSSRVDLWIDDVPVARRGARHPAYREEQGVAAMRKPEFTVRAVLNRGKAEATLWTCDLSFDYVKINAEYRT